MTFFPGDLFDSLSFLLSCLNNITISGEVVSIPKHQANLGEGEDGMMGEGLAEKLPKNALTHACEAGEMVLRCL